MKKNTIYKINIKNWDKYNKNIKKGYKAVLISTGFLTDAKVSVLPNSGKLLYLSLLLRCGEDTTNMIECSHDLLTMSAGGRGVLVAKLLDQLQSLQLLTYEKVATNIIENKIIETKLKEGKGIQKHSATKELKKTTEELTKAKALRAAVWQVYYSCYIKRYKVEPVRNAKVNSCISKLVDRVGTEAPDIVNFYLQHPKSFYVSKMHDISLCLADAEALRTQWLRGQAVTESDIKRYSKNQESRSLDEAIERGEV